MLSNAKKGGFTLLEVVLSLVLAGVVGTIAGMGLVQFTKGFVFAKKNTVTAQKGQFAMSRILKELGSATAVSSSPALSKPWPGPWESRLRTSARKARRAVLSGTILGVASLSFEVSFGILVPSGNVDLRTWTLGRWPKAADRRPWTV